jgi:uncharacterized protein
MTLDTVVVIAKQPVPGRVKTRLIGDFSPAQAAELAAAALLDTFDLLDQIPCQHRVLLFDGDSGAWARRGWQVMAQSGGSLDQRLSCGFDNLGDGPALLLGMDTPHALPPQLCFDPDTYDCCLGLAADGGFWAIGFREPNRARSAIHGVPMSVAGTGAMQHQRLREQGMSIQLLDQLRDIDTPADARSVALSHPRTRFSREWWRQHQVGDAGR